MHAAVSGVSLWTVADELTMACHVWCVTRVCVIGDRCARGRDSRGARFYVDSGIVVCYVWAAFRFGKSWDAFFILIHPNGSNLFSHHISLLWRSRSKNPSRDAPSLRAGTEPERAAEPAGHANQ